MNDAVLAALLPSLMTGTLASSLKGMRLPSTPSAPALSSPSLSTMLAAKFPKQVLDAWIASLHTLCVLDTSSAALLSKHTELLPNVHPALQVAFEKLLALQSKNRDSSNVLMHRLQDLRMQSSVTMLDVLTALMQTTAAPFG